MSADRNVRCDDPEAFFAESGSAWMRLTAAAAIHVCALAARRGWIVARIEGGIWHHPGFEARVDCIWDGADPPVSTAEAGANNQRAARFIEDEGGQHDTFVITAAPLAGWPHRS